MEPIRVVCAIILHEGKILVAQRSNTMKLPLKWEFPGGKVNPAETDEESLHRELWEELKITVSIKRCLRSYYYDYGDFQINLIPFVAQYNGGKITLIEHKSVVWLDKHELVELDWAPADIPIVNDLTREYL